jgi:hypothetical protein
VGKKEAVMSTNRRDAVAGRTAIGGAADEQGSEFRARCAAWLACAGLRGAAVDGMGVESASAVPIAVDLEVDDVPDDIVVTFLNGARARIQVKLRCGLGPSDRPFNEALKQFKVAVREDPQPDGDSLVLLANHASRALKHLGAALDRARLRRPGAPSRAEARARETLDGMLASLAPPEVGTLLARMHVVEHELLAPTSADYENAVLLLDGAVVAPGRGREALRWLVDQARALAQIRAGQDMHGWRDLLRQRGIPLVTDASSSAAAASEAREAAERRYRERVISAASTIELRSLNFPLRPVSVDDPGEHLRARPLEQRGSDQVRLHWAVRRRGRCLLVGLPGAGKTVALRQLAGYWAARNEAPLPIYVALPLMREQVRARHLTDLIVDAATDVEPAEDRDLLRAVFGMAIGRGSAAMFLDGLDECRTETGAVVAAIGRWLADLPEGDEVVIASRHSAYGAAHTLGLGELELLPPADLDRFVQGLLEQYAEALDVPDANRPAWVATRAEWVGKTRSSGGSIADTAFHQVLLTAYAATNDISPEPLSRARVYRAVVEGTLGQLEITSRRQGDLTIDGLGSESARQAAMGAFAVVGNVLEVSDPSDTEALRRQVDDYLRSAWGCTRGHARAGAEDALHVWDVAGFFVREGTRERTRSRLRLFAELGAAIQATEMERGERVTWLRDHLSTTGEDVAVLAASLSSELAEDLIDTAVWEGGSEAVTIAARAVREGAQPAGAAVARLSEALRQRIGTATETVLYRAACDLAQLPVSHQTLDLNLALLGTLPRKWGPVPVMLAMMRADAGDEARLEAARDAMRVDPGDVPARTSPMVERNYDAAFLAAARELIKHGDSDDLTSMIAARERVSHGTVRRIEGMLWDAGHRDLVAQTYASDFAWVVRFAERADQTREKLARYWRRVAGDPAQRREESPSRRLAALGDLLTTLDYNNWGMLDLNEAVDDADGQALEAAIRLVAELAGISWEDVSADAAVLEDPRCELGDVADGGSDRPLTHWPSGERGRAIREQLADLIAKPRLVARTSAHALVRAPERRATLAACEQRLADPDHPRRPLMAAVAMTVAQDRARRAQRWFDTDDGALRLVAAAAASRLYKGRSHLEGILLAAVGDADAAVRNAALRHLGPQDLNPPLRSTVESAFAEEPTVWTCPECGTTNGYDAQRCPRCRESVPQWHWRARDLLGGRGGNDHDEWLWDGY